MAEDSSPHDYDPFSATTRRVRRNLLAVSFVAILFELGALESADAAGVLGVKVVDEYLPVLLLVLIAYLVISLWLHWKDDDLNRPFPSNSVGILAAKVDSVEQKFRLQVRDKLNRSMRLCLPDLEREEFRTLPPNQIDRWVKVFSGIVAEAYMNVADVNDTEEVYDMIDRIFDQASGDEWFDLAKAIPRDSYLRMLSPITRLAGRAYTTRERFRRFSYTAFRTKKIFFELGLPFLLSGGAILAISYGIAVKLGLAG